MVVCVGGTTLRLMSKVPVPSRDSRANPSDESEGEQGIAHPVSKSSAFKAEVYSY
jgi:hypothetical protein